MTSPKISMLSTYPHPHPKPRFLLAFRVCFWRLSKEFGNGNRLNISYKMESPVHQGHKRPKHSGRTFTGKGSRLKILNKDLIDALLHFEHL